MFLTIFYPFIKFALGTLYPAYKTWKSLKRKDETIRRRWMKYWISFSVFQVLEYFADLTIAFIVPFYIELKISAIMWLVHMRASSLIDSAIDKELKRREKIIDSWLRRFHNEFVGVIWFEFSRLAIKLLAFLLKSMAASHHIPIDQPMETDEECDMNINSNNSNYNNNNNNNNNNELGYNISEEPGDIAEASSPRAVRYKRDRGSTVQVIDTE